MKNLNLSLIIFFALIFIKCTVENDNILVDGSIKPNETVKICNQIWMIKNLDVDRYRNGDSIPEVRDSIEWANLKTGAWCYFNNDSVYGKIYGKLYNWYAVNDPRGLAPGCWHIPSDEEWKTLEMCLGMSSADADVELDWRGTNEGGKLKESGTANWLSPNTGATNESGFSALSGGYRLNYGTFSPVGNFGFWWSSSETIAGGAFARGLSYDGARIYRYGTNKEDGFSVRCLKD